MSLADNYRAVTRDQVVVFQTRRLEAIEHVASRIQGNPYTTKTPYALPDLAKFSDMAETLAHALHEFVTIEQLVELADWKVSPHLFLHDDVIRRRTTRCGWALAQPPFLHVC